MQTFFLICAAFGGTLMVCQFLASLIGLGGDHDTDHGGLGDAGHDVGGDTGTDMAHDIVHDTGHDTHDADQGSSSWYFGMLSFRALSAAFAFFGLSGLAAYFGGLEPGQSLLVALAGGAAALYLVASMMRMLAKLRSDGTVRIERAVGTVGTVYLRIPGHRAGAGKVTLVLQGRSVECPAITAEDDLPTGSRVRVVAVVGPDTLEVAPVTTETPAHV
jgi:membrane protein implicated in regulation of membrane protease activity